VDKNLNYSRKNATQQGNNRKVPASYYYKTQVIGVRGSKFDESERKGKVDSIKIRIDPKNDSHKEKDMETVFKEGEDEEDMI
jgi:hypothetical protein